MSGQRCGQTARWLATIPDYARSVAPQILAVFTHDPETDKKVKAMNLSNVVVNPKPPKRPVTIFWDEAEEIYLNNAITGATPDRKEG